MHGKIVLVHPDRLCILNVFALGSPEASLKHAFLHNDGQFLVRVTDTHIHAWQLQLTSDLELDTRDLNGSTLFKFSRRQVDMLCLIDTSRKVFVVDSGRMLLRESFTIDDSVLDVKYCFGEYVVCLTRHRQLHRLQLREIDDFDSPKTEFILHENQHEVIYFDSQFDRRTSKLTLVVFDELGVVSSVRFRLVDGEISRLACCDEQFIPDVVKQSQAQRESLRGQRNSKNSLKRLKKNRMYYYVKLLGDTKKPPKKVNREGLSRLRYTLKSLQFVPGTDMALFVFSLDGISFFLGCLHPQSSSSDRGQRRISAVRIKNSHLGELMPENRFKLVAAKKKTAVFAYVYGTQGVLVYSLGTCKSQFEFLAKLACNINASTELAVVAERDLVYWANNRQLELWSMNLKTQIFRQAFDNYILGFFVADDRASVVVYDQESCSLFDSNILETVSVQTCSEPCGLRFAQTVDVGLLGPDRRVTLPAFEAVSRRLSNTANAACLSLGEFPVHSLLQAFDPEQYAAHVEVLRRFYFAQTPRRMRALGFLNPFTFAIYHNDQRLLKSMLKRHDIPYDYKGTISVIEYAFRQRHYALIKYLCHKLYYKSSPQYISKQDFSILLRDPRMKGDKLIAHAFIRLDSLKALDMLYMASDVHISLNANLQDFLVQIKRKSLRDRGRNEHLQMSSVEILSTSFEYDFSVGSRESIRFLDCYSRSSSPEMVHSDWKHLVLLKWNSLFKVNLAMAAWYWVFMAVITLNLVFACEQNAHIKRLLNFLTYVLTLSLMLVELVQLASMCSFGVSKYFELGRNLVDTCIVVCVLVYINIESSVSPTASELLGTYVLMLVYYRGFVYLEVIPPLTSLVTIIHTIIKRMVSYVLILFYFYACFVLIFARLGVQDGPEQPPQSARNYLMMSYIWLVYGGMDTTGIAQNSPVALVLIYGNFLITIILMNILIAYLANLYSELEQEIATKRVQEMATVVLDFEVIVYAYRRIFRRKGAREVGLCAD